MPDSVKPVTSLLKSHPSVNVSPTSPHPHFLQFEDPKFDLKDVTVEELARAANVSVDTIKHAIYVREQHMKAEHRAMLAAKLRDEFIRTSTTFRTPPTSTTTMAPTMRPTSSLSGEKSSFVGAVTPIKTLPSNYAQLDNLLAIKVSPSRKPN